MKWKNKGHEFDKIGTNFKKNMMVYIYGAGENGTNLFYKLGFADCVAGFIDNDSKYKNQMYLGKPVLSIIDFLEKKPMDVIIVVTNTSFVGQFMLNQLRQIGYQEGINLFEVRAFERYYLPIFAMYSWDKLYYSSISITTTFRCNLKCKACLAFVPYNKNPQDEDINNIKESLDLFFKSVDFVDFIDIAGGEPLLYPYLLELLIHIGENYREKINKIFITTNGTIIPSNEICDLVKKYDYTIKIDDYSLTIGKRSKIEEIEVKLKNKEVNYLIFRVDNWIDLDIKNTDNAHMSETELENYFIACQQEWPELFDKKLFYCDYSTYAARAGMIELYDDEAFDLEKVTYEKRMELFEYGRGYSEKGYVEMCKRCAGYHGINMSSVEAAGQETAGE